MRNVRPLYHGIYTNAFGTRGEGFRSLFVAPPWPADERRRVADWLLGLEPVGDGEWAAAAMNCFRLGRIIHACLVRVDGGFARDEHGRGGGVLVHALLLPLEEGRPCGDFGLALVQAAAAFRRPAVADTDKLEAYLVQCRAKMELAVPSLDVGALLGLDGGVLARFFDLVARKPQGVEVPFAVDAESRLAELLALAGGLLPPRLRLACRWGVGLRAATSLSFLARAAGAKASLPADGAAGDAYLRWLRQHLEAGREAEVMTRLESWHIRSWDGLMH